MAARYREIWVEDFEFYHPEGERIHTVHCWAGRELLSGRRASRWLGDGEVAPPYDATDPAVLAVAFQAQAEAGARLRLGWPTPRYIDLHVELRSNNRGRTLPRGDGLLGALSAYRLPADGAVEKAVGRAIAMRPSVPPEQRATLQRYCMSDVDLLASLAIAMWPTVDTPRAISRGAFQIAAAGMHDRGLPFDTPRAAFYEEHWPSIQLALIATKRDQFDLYEGTTLKDAKVLRFVEQYETRTGRTWPRTVLDGKPSTDKDVLKVLAKSDPDLEPLRELIRTIRQTRMLDELTIGTDHRNRYWVDSFKQISGRDTLYGDCILGYPKWERGFIAPPEGLALAVLDYANQEPRVAWGLSGDPMLGRVCLAKDPYIELAILFGKAPKGATEDTHPAIRKVCKVVFLGVMYGEGPATLSQVLGCSLSEARELLALHRRLFSRFWEWTHGVVARALMDGVMTSVLGTTRHLIPTTATHTLLNWSMQAGGAELTHMATAIAAAQGVEVLATQHDSLMLQAPEEDIRDAVATASRIMNETGRAMFGVPFDVKVDPPLRYPERYLHKDGAAMWAEVDFIARKLGFRECRGNSEGGMPANTPHHSFDSSFF